MGSPADPLTTYAVAALRGERAALEPLCRGLEGPLYRLALRVLGDPSDAQDATQEVLMQVVTHLSQFRSESSVSTWAYAIAVRYFLRVRKRRSRRDMRELAGRIEAGLAATHGVGLQLSTGESAVHERETRLGCTHAMLTCLSLEERLAVILSEILGADDDLGARLCEVAPATYRKRLSRARAKLAPVLERLCGLADRNNPCTCARQTVAKSRVGPPTDRYTRLPIVDSSILERATENLGAVRALGAVFAMSQTVAPPASMWREIRERLAPLL